MSCQPIVIPAGKYHLVPNKLLMIPSLNNTFMNILIRSSSVSALDFALNLIQFSQSIQFSILSPLIPYTFIFLLHVIYFHFKNNLKIFKT
jgi:ABC-type amino acid transport system permease subunit